jgi:hypothetical protein
VRGISKDDAGAQERALCRARGSLPWIACAVLAGAALAGPSAADAIAEAAPPFHSREGGFTAAFPEAPRYEEKRESTLAGVLRTRSWEVERGALRLRVERHDVPALATVTLGADALLERAARELLAELRAQAPRNEPVRLRTHPGRHLRYEPGDRPGETEDAWLYLLGHRLYVIFARGAAPTSRAAALHFARSVELLEDAGPP